MLSQHETPVTAEPLKKGWIYKKGFLTFKPKYVVFSTVPKPNLMIFDSRDVSKPKYQIFTDAIAVNVPQFQSSSLFSFSSAPTFDFILETRTRKFHLRAQTANERNEWVDILRNFSRFHDQGEYYPTNIGKDLQSPDNYDTQSVYSYWSTADRRSIYGRAESSIGRASSRGSLHLSQSALSSLAQSSRSSLGLVNDEEDTLISGSTVDLDIYPQIPHLWEILPKETVKTLLADLYSDPTTSKPSNNIGNSSSSKSTNWNAIHQSSSGLERARILGEFRSVAEQALKSIVHSSLSIPQVFQHGSILFHVGGKKADLELKSINALNFLFKDSQLQIATSLVCCLSYRGVSVIACPILPLTENTRVSGNEVREEIASFGRTDNLEIHSVDGYYYVINTHGILPRDEQWVDPHFRYRHELIFMNNSDNSLLGKRMDLKERLKLAIKEFALRCDNLEMNPVDSLGLTIQLHKAGINVRYLGLLCNSVSLPHMKDLCRVEMVARTVKAILNDKISKCVERYKNIEATNIDNDLNSVALKLINLVLQCSSKTWENVSTIIHAKFRVTMSFNEFMALHKPSLLMAIQHHCGVRVLMPANGNLVLPLGRSMFEGFTVKTKLPVVLDNEKANGNLSMLQKHGYNIAKHFLITGGDKFERNELTAMKFLPLARYLYEQGHQDQASFICNLAYRFAPFGHPCASILRAHFIEFLCANSQFEVFKHLDLTLSSLSNTIGSNHPIIITIYDKAVLKLCAIGLEEVAFELISKSLSLSTRILGVSHPTTAGYKTKAGYLLMTLHRYKDAIGLFKEALQHYKQLLSSPSNKNSKHQYRESMAENLYCLAECLYECGLASEAVSCSLESKQIRETLHGHLHPKTVDSYQQYSKLLSLPLIEYSGVLTDKMKEDLKSAIICYEKVFRYMKHSKADTSVLLELTRTLFALKLKLLTGQQKEIVRLVKNEKVIYDEVILRDVIVKLVHVTPTVYLEELLQRLGDQDIIAKRELGAVLQIVDNSRISISKSDK